MAWDYAKLSKVAKDVGGPEKLMDLLFEAGKDAGHKEMLPIIGIALGIGALLYAGISELLRFFKKKEQISPEEVEVAKAELIKGIEEYDVTHPTEDEQDSNVGGENDE